MNVILLEKVENLGGIGDKVNVKAGYGRNFLLPNGKATLATAANMEQFEARRAELEKKAAGELAVAQKRAAGLNESRVEIKRWQVLKVNYLAQSAQPILLKH